MVGTWLSLATQYCTMFKNSPRCSYIRRLGWVLWELSQCPTNYIWCEHQDKWLSLLEPFDSRWGSHNQACSEHVAQVGALFVFYINALLNHYSKILSKPTVKGTLMWSYMHIQYSNIKYCICWWSMTNVNSYPISLIILFHVYIICQLKLRNIYIISISRWLPQKTKTGDWNMHSHCLCGLPRSIYRTKLWEYLLGLFLIV